MASGQLGATTTNAPSPVEEALKYEREHVQIHSQNMVGRNVKGMRQSKQTAINKDVRVYHYVLNQNS